MHPSVHFVGVAFVRHVCSEIEFLLSALSESVGVFKPLVFRWRQDSHCAHFSERFFVTYPIESTAVKHIGLSRTVLLFIRPIWSTRRAFSHPRSVLTGKLTVRIRVRILAQFDFNVTLGSHARILFIRLFLIPAQPWRLSDVAFRARPRKIENLARCTGYGHPGVCEITIARIRLVCYTLPHPNRLFTWLSLILNLTPAGRIVLVKRSIRISMSHRYHVGLFDAT